MDNQQENHSPSSINIELINFIIQSRSAGKKDEEIRGTLLRNGWKDSEIRMALESLPTQTPQNSRPKKLSGNSVFLIIVITLLVLVGFFIQKNNNEKKKEADIAIEYLCVYYQTQKEMGVPLEQLSKDQLRDIFNTKMQPLMKRYNLNFDSLGIEILKIRENLIKNPSLLQEYNSVLKQKQCF